MATTNSWNNQIASANSAITLNSGTNAINISTDASATTVALATGGAVKGLTCGSTNGASASTFQSGSGALNVTSTNGALTINSGTGTLGISTDASATTCNMCTGGAAKAVTLGSTNGASSLALKYGTADFSLASATGNIMVALDTGEITKPLQPAFLAQLDSNRSNVTGDDTLYTVVWGTEIFDQNSDWDNVSTFTAPVTGRYQFNFGILSSGILVAHTIYFHWILTSNRSYIAPSINPGAITASGGGSFSLTMSIFTDMDSGDTAIAKFQVGGSTKVVGLTVGGATDPRCYFSGYLVC